MRLELWIKHRLLVRRRLLLDRSRDELRRAEVEIATSDADGHDAEVPLRLGDADAEALQEVAAAIARFDAGSYGRCVLCLHDIGALRLLALPAVATCISCATRTETRAS